MLHAYLLIKLCCDSVFLAAKPFNVSTEEQGKIPPRMSYSCKRTQKLYILVSAEATSHSSLDAPR